MEKHERQKMILYLLHTEDSNHVKFGFTKNLEQRLRSLQTGAQLKWIVFSTFSFVGTKKDSMIVEKFVEDQLRKYRKSQFGEVVEISKKDLNWVNFFLKTNGLETLRKYKFKEFKFIQKDNYEPQKETKEKTKPN
jgi:uncharacterized protein YlbG (UPF0298 family)